MRIVLFELDRQFEVFRIGEVIRDDALATTPTEAHPEDRRVWERMLECLATQIDGCQGGSTQGHGAGADPLLRPLPLGAIWA